MWYLCSVPYLYSVLKSKFYQPIYYIQYIPLTNFWRHFKAFNHQSEKLNTTLPGHQQLVNVIFTKSNGEKITLLGETGKSVMEVAVKEKDVYIMEGSCDGKLACVSCHVYVNENSKKYFPKPSLDEEDLLDVAEFRKDNSRLSCQLILSSAMSEVQFSLPPSAVNEDNNSRVKRDENIVSTDEKVPINNENNKEN